jgi:hypothetical protein
MEHESLAMEHESPATEHESLAMELESLAMELEPLEGNEESPAVSWQKNKKMGRYGLVFNTTEEECMGTDWYYNSREDQLHMVKTWNKVFAAQGQTWGIPQDRIAQLASDGAAAQAILDKVKSGERTASDVVQCNLVFKDMEAEARFIKKHYLLVPPLTLADLANLLLPLPDSRTPVPPPTGQPGLTIAYPGGPHVLTVHLAPLPGTEPPDSRGDYGYALYRGVMPQGGATLEQAASAKHYLMHEPRSGEELLHYRFTRRRKELVDFDPSESGMTAYFCSRYENQKGEHGNWGAVVKGIIP